MPDPQFDEQAFMKWFTPTAKKLELSPDPNDPEAFYNYRGFYNAMKAGKYRSPAEPGQHWPSEFKDPNHPRLYLTDPVNGRYFNTDTGNYTGGAKEPVSETRMNELNNIDTQDLPRREWNLAKGGADQAVPNYKAIGENLTVPNSGEKLAPEQTPLTVARAKEHTDPSFVQRVMSIFSDH